MLAECYGQVAAALWGLGKGSKYIGTSYATFQIFRHKCWASGESRYAVVS